MTSSLVGSEMCIRDSCLASDPLGWLGSSAAPDFPRPPDLNPRFGQNCTCLLYTSDAADDM
eukprot:10879527-Prorocentrum_lima.AAC.1